ncbi:general substrate transporter [Daldinia vernicosa]|uniref:general substrate transporter n=1 Tax=Daldinia vernicosa TaxID=114800 RepID=UPI0020088F40|nr:general substrate transporter [Daldinia vernicosa]KAI0852933.1 general substrate transporter [Daldinia vernicosa]
MVSSKRLYNWYIALVAAMCMVLYGYDASVFNAAQGSDNWLEWFNLDTTRDANLIGLINTAYTIGAIVAGWFFGGPVADYFGRRVGMGIGCILTIAATFMQAFAPWHNLGCFIGGRVLIGIGQGMALTAGPIYIGEVSPPEIRGQIMAFWQMFYSVGSFIAYWIAYACNANKEKLGHWDWRMVVIFQILVPIIIIVLLPFQPESPRWWIKRHNNVEEAKKALRKIRETEQDVEFEVLSIREAIEFEKEAASGSYLALFKDPSVRKRLYLAFILNVGQQLSGQGTLNSYSSAIYKTIWPSTQTINLINALNATCGILFTLNAVWTADRFGRRWLFIVGAIGMGICMLIVPIIGMTTPDVVGATGTATKTEPVGIAIVFLLFLFIFFYKPSWGATTWIWTSEVFSMNVRAQAVGMCSQMQNVANTIFQQFFPIFLAREGLKCLFFFMAANFLLAVFVWFCIPETMKIPLEEIDALFGGQNHVEKGGQMLGITDAHSIEEKPRVSMQQQETAKDANV